MDAKAQLRQELKAAREALDKKQWSEALQHCRAALKLDSKNYNAFVFVGLAAAELGQEEKSEEAYRRASALQPTTVLAWQVSPIVFSFVLPPSPSVVRAGHGQAFPEHWAVDQAG